MKASELRIGNHVYDDDNQVVKIENILSDKCVDWNDQEYSVLFSKNNESNNMYYSRINPIPLTDEWLENLGALKDEHGDVFIEVDSDLDTRLYLSTKRYIQLVKSYHCPMFDYEHIRYVHQLQNLYFALTGEELTIKEAK